MNIVFFQNCISPHQMPYINELYGFDGVEDVVVVSPVDDLDERKSMGWGTKDGKFDSNQSVSILISPCNEEIVILLNKYAKRNTWCLFSGINAFPEVSAWFRLSLKYNVRRGVITEPPYTYSHPLWQHAIRFALKDWRYTKYIDKFFVMGDEYLWYYKMWSRKWDVIPFMYCTEWRERTRLAPSCEKLKILYVGALSNRKNVAELLNAIKELGKYQSAVELGVVGDGIERTKLEKIVDAGDYCAETLFYGSKSMNVVPEIMQQYDILVLPSLHDGWGAVVNEALSLGLYVICSNKCGAKYLLKNQHNGLVYHSGKHKELTSCIMHCLENKNDIRSTMTDRIEWANKYISGHSVADYFFNCLRKQS